MKKPLLALPLISSSHKKEAKPQNRIKSKSQTETAQKQDLSQELLRESCLATALQIWALSKKVPSPAAGQSLA